MTRNVIFINDWSDLLWRYIRRDEEMLRRIVPKVDAVIKEKGHISNGEIGQIIREDLDANNPHADDGQSIWQDIIGSALDRIDYAAVARELMNPANFPPAQEQPRGD